MNASTSPSQPAAAGQISPTEITTAEIDASCRWPVLLLLVCSAVWLTIGSVFALIATIKFHSPNFLADCAWLTYGRVHAAHLNIWVYGAFAQGGLAVALWLLCRLGQTRLALPGTLIAAALLWNLGVKLGVLGILSGDGTGFEWLEMPRPAALILFLAYALIGIVGLTTFARRRVSALFVSQWFIVAALFWFPWIYSSANLLLVVWPVRGVMQAVVNGWYANNLITIWFGFLGLAIVFYFVPKLINRPLYSRNLALLIFWTLALFGSWAGIQSGAPLPAWLPALSSAAALMTVVPVLGVALSVQRTLAGTDSAWRASLPLRFIVFGAAAFVVAGLMGAVTAPVGIGSVTQFTWFAPAQTQLFLYGFLAMVMFGALYHLVPRLAQRELPCSKLPRLHFWCAAVGILFLTVPLAIGGVVQGLKLNDASVPFLEVSKGTLPFLRASTLGDLLLALGHLFLLANLLWLVCHLCCACCFSVIAAKVKSPTMEVAA